MQKFKFKATDKDGVIHKGVVLANDKNEAVNSLAKLEFNPLGLRRALIFKFLQDFVEKLAAKDKIFLARNLNIILQSGLGLTEGARILLRGMKNSGLKNFLIHFILTVERGSPISKAFSDFPRYFSEIDVEIIKVGEFSGNLSSTLKKWAEDLERDKEIKNTIVSALIYPIIILVVAIAVLILLITFVMPKIASLVQQIGGHPPKATQIIVSVSLFLGNNVNWFLAITFGVIVLFIIFALSPLGRKFFLKVFIKSFLTKKLALDLVLRNFCFTVGNLLEAGVNLTDSLKLMENTVFHPDFRRTIKNVREKIIQGMDFGDSIMSEKNLPGYFSGILGISSRTGAISSVLLVLRDYYEAEVKLKIKNLISMIEPMLLVFIGLVVGGIALAILIPIYQQISTQLGAT
jgi:type II secretory pathway component PulF